MDLQAHDRAHRIGQTKTVLIFRLVSRHTIESKIMQRASEKRQFEALVIAKGTYPPIYVDHHPLSCALVCPQLLKNVFFILFLNPPRQVQRPIGGGAKAGEARQTIAEMAVQLLELEGEHIEVVQSTAAGKRSVISDAELDMLLDRRKEVFEGRGSGWKSGAAAKDAKADDVTTRAGMARAERGDAESGLFEVYEALADEGNDALAHLLGEDLAA